MRNSFFLVLILLSLSSCAVRKNPEFVKVDSVRVISFDPKNIRLSADAIFKNPNDIGGTLSSDGVDVWVNGEHVAKVTSKPFKVPAKKEFALPMIVEIPTKKIFNNKNSGFLTSIIDAVKNNSIKVQFRGELKFKTFGFSHVFPVNSSQLIKIK